MGMSLPSAHLATPKKPLPTYAPISCPTAVHSSAHPHKISIVNIVNNNPQSTDPVAEAVGAMRPAQWFFPLVSDGLTGSRGDQQKARRGVSGPGTNRQFQFPE